MDTRAFVANHLATGATVVATIEKTEFVFAYQTYGCRVIWSPYWRLR
jgi:hypothetical protein